MAFLATDRKCKSSSPPKERGTLKKFQLKPYENSIKQVIIKAPIDILMIFFKLKILSFSEYKI